MDISKNPTKGFIMLNWSFPTETGKDLTAVANSVLATSSDTVGELGQRLTKPQSDRFECFNATNPAFSSG